MRCAELCHILSVNEYAYLNNSRDRFKTCQLTQAAHHSLEVSLSKPGRFVCLSPFLCVMHTCNHHITFISCRFHFLHQFIFMYVQFYYNVFTVFPLQAHLEKANKKGLCQIKKLGIEGELNSPHLYFCDYV